MCNCGKKRQTLNTGSPSALFRSQSKRISKVTMPMPPGYNGIEPVLCTYTGTDFLTVNSRDGNYAYNFSPTNRVLSVKPVDVQVLQKYNELRFEM